MSDFEYLESNSRFEIVKSPTTTYFYLKSELLN